MCTYTHFQSLREHKNLPHPISQSSHILSASVDTPNILHKTSVRHAMPQKIDSVCPQIRNTLAFETKRNVRYALRIRDRTIDASMPIRFMPLDQFDIFFDRFLSIETELPIIKCNGREFESRSVAQRRSEAHQNEAVRYGMVVRRQSCDREPSEDDDCASSTGVTKAGRFLHVHELVCTATADVRTNRDIGSCFPHLLTGARARARALERKRANVRVREPMRTRPHSRHQQRQ